MLSPIRIGCAGWNIDRNNIGRFPNGPSILHRYAGRYPTVEINSSFYRPHRKTTYARWADCVGDDFLFSVKVPKIVTHEARLRVEDDSLDRFLDEVSGLGDKLGVLLVQLPPSLEFDASTARTFFQTLRAQTAAGIVCEPRHPSWFDDEAEEMFVTCGVGRVVADPLSDQRGTEPGGSLENVYLRLHGSPRRYYSGYDETALKARAGALRRFASAGSRVWCIFDNTAAGEAIPNSWSLLDMIEDRDGVERPKHKLSE